MIISLDDALRRRAGKACDGVEMGDNELEDCAWQARFYIAGWVVKGHLRLVRPSTQVLGGTVCCRRARRRRDLRAIFSSMWECRSSDYQDRSSR